MSQKPLPKKPAGPAAPAEPAYRMPAVEVGDVVVWTHGPDEDDGPMALVTAVATEVVNLAVLDPDAFNFRPIDGVRHREFPDRGRIFATESGCWRHRASHLELLRRIEALSPQAPAVA